METMACKIILIVGGFLLFPILGGLLDRGKGFSKFGIMGMFAGSLVSLTGFGLCVWNCIYTSCGYCTALIVFLIAWLAFLFLAFSIYSVQLKK